MSRQSWNKLSINRDVNEVLKLYKYLNKGITSNNVTINEEAGIARLKLTIYKMLKKINRYYHAENFDKI